MLRPCSLPAFLFAFANDVMQSLRLTREWNALEEAFQTGADRGTLTFNLIHAAALEDIFKKLNRFHNRVVIFHYSGHSNEDVLNLVDQPLRSKNLATVLGQEQNLKLVFLNGCFNAVQVKALFDRGVPAVIATSAPIDDSKAIRFSTHFYQSLNGGRSILEAFEMAAAFINNEGNVELIAQRGIGRLDPTKKELPWGLYTQRSDVLDWRIPREGSLSSEVGRAISGFHTPFPALAERIVGREEEIKQLRSKLSISKVPVLVTGMGGLGKTRMVIEYVNRYKEEYDYIVWIDQVNDFVSDLTANNLLKQALGIQLTQNREADAQSILFKLSRLKGSLLLVIDNTNEQIIPWTSHLPKPPLAHVVVTSRIEIREYFIPAPLGFLDPSFAEELFYQYYRLEKDQEIVSHLLEKIDYHTLTIELMAKTANRRRIRLSDLSRLIAERGLAWRRRADDIRLLRDPQNQLKRIFPFLQLVFDMRDLSSEEEALLHQLAALPPIFIPVEGLTYLFDVDWREEQKWDDFLFHLSQLQEKGWLISGEDTYKMHRVVQDVIWERIKPSFKSLELLVEKVTNLLTFDQSKDNPIQKTNFVPFGERLIVLFPQTNCENAARLRSELGWIYWEMGRYSQAQMLFEAALHWYEEADDEHVLQMAKLWSNLGVVHKALGNYYQALTLLKKALKQYLSYLKPSHPNVAAVQSNLGMLYKEIGQYDQSERLLKNVLESDVSNFGESHPNVAISQCNLAAVYQDLNRFESAVELLEKALTSNRQNFGDTHPTVSRNESNLALAYRSLGQYEKAVRLLEKVLKQEIANFGDKHPRIANRQSNLAMAYQDLGEYDRAASLLESALASARKNYGSNHLNTATIQANLADAYLHLVRYEDAVVKLEEAMGIIRTIFGSQHDYVKRLEKNLITALEKGIADRDIFCMNYKETKNGEA